MQDRAGLPSASLLPIIAKCPGSWKAIQGIPDEPSNAAEFGNQVHALAADEIDEMSASERASLVARSAEKIWEKIAIQLFGSLDGLYIWKETRFWMRDKNNERCFSAKADKIVAKGNTVLITDIKALTGDVDDADSNFQILGISCCFIDDDEQRLTQMSEAPLTVYGAIIQPLVTKQPIIVKYDINQLLIARRQIARMLEESKSDIAVRIPGNHCRLCKARGTCPAAISMPMLLSSPSLAIDTLSPDQLAELLPRLPVVESICESIRVKAKQLAEAKQLPGYEIKERQGKMTITDLKNIKAARTALEPHVTQEEFQHLISLPVGQLRELFTKRYAETNRTTKAEAGKIFTELLENASSREAPTKMLVKKKE